jgi:Zn finger protein HypA/HybF involved in hydrogenase expression
MSNSNEKATGYRITARRSGHMPAGKWWCPSCRKLIEAEKNPITCAECGDDTTIAPLSALKE